MNVYDILNLLGGIALFLFGMHTLSASLEKLAGGKLETWLEKATSKPIKGVVLGAIITAVIQSSAATTVMIIGFVNSGLMKLSQAIGVIMGANIGTTATSWLLSLQSISGSDGFSFLNLLKPTTFTPVLAVIGVILIMFTKSDKKKTIGMILAGFAVLMFGMNSMSSATAGLAENETFCNILMMFSNPVLGVIAGAVLTAVLQSSSASIGILQSIAISTGKVTYSVALPLLLGQNIGSCVTALISSVGANKPAKRVAFVHLYFNVIGTVVFLSIFYLLNAFISMPFMEESLNAVGIAVIHTGFNVLATALFLPFTKQLEKLACLTVRDDSNDEKLTPMLLDERLLKTPSVAIEQCRNVCIRMARLTQETLKMSMEVVTTYDAKKCAEVIDNENAIDIFEDKIGSYILKISSKDLSENDSKIVSSMLHTIGDLERISDHAVNIVEAAEEMHSKKIKFSQQALRELPVIVNAVSEILDMSINAFINNDVNLAKNVEPLEDVIDQLRSDLKTRHIERLRNGKCTIELGFILQDLLTNFERVSDHCSNIAVYLIQISDNSMDTHEYMNELKKLDRSEFMDEFNDYKNKYILPEQS
ncbi:MAG: Na/Pi cotransporter family protein [Eubacterium sp.]|nr:Na/Pi cotransporter family protein [Eubacterium sp.]